MRQFNRTVTLSIGGQTLALRTIFEIEKEMTAAGASKCEIKIYNLSRASQNALEVGNQKQLLELSAGYGGRNKLIYAGPIFYAETAQQGPDIVTSCQMLPGAAALGSAFVKVAGAGNGYNIYGSVLNAIKPHGVVQGTLSNAALGKLEAASYDAKFSDIDSVAGLMDKICRHAGLTWNIHDQQLNVYLATEYQNDELILLDKSSGMLGVPSKTQEGNYKVRALLNADLAPGQRVRVTSSDFPVEGDLRIIKTTHRGDSFPLEPGAKWETEIEGVNIGTLPGFVLGGS